MQTAKADPDMSRVLSGCSCGKRSPSGQLVSWVESVCCYSNLSTPHCSFQIPLERAVPLCTVSGLVCVREGGLQCPCSALITDQPLLTCSPPGALAPSALVEVLVTRCCPMVGGSVTLVQLRAQPGLCHGAWGVAVGFSQRS